VPWRSTRNGLDACWLPPITCRLYIFVLSMRLALELDRRRRIGKESASKITRGRDGICALRVVI
jgi:hypothetical protein